MARVFWTTSLLNPDGTPLQGATITILGRSRATPVSIYQQSTGSSTVATPLTTDGTGKASFWLDDKIAYNITISGTGFQSYTDYFDAVSAESFNNLLLQLSSLPGGGGSGGAVGSATPFTYAAPNTFTTLSSGLTSIQFPDGTQQVTAFQRYATPIGQVSFTLPNDIAYIDLNETVTGLKTYTTPVYINSPLTINSRAGQPGLVSLNIIQATPGIRFSDGTLITSASNLGRTGAGPVTATPLTTIAPSNIPSTNQPSGPAVNSQGIVYATPGVQFSDGTTMKSVVGIGALPAVTLDLIGHSLAGGGGATDANWVAGWVDKLISQIPGRFRDASRGGSIACLPEGVAGTTGGTVNYGGAFRVLQDFPGQPQRGSEWPFPPQSHVAIIWHGANDIGLIGSLNTLPITESIRAEIARMRVAIVYEDSSTSALNGITPVAYSGTNAWTANAGWGIASGSAYSYQTVPYTGVNNNKITMQVLPDFNVTGGILQFGFVCGGGSVGACNGAVWELHDVTSGDTLINTWNLTGIATVIAGSTPTTGITKQVPVVRRQSFTLGPTTTVNGNQWLGNGATPTLFVQSTTGFAATGVIRVNNQLLSYTGLSGTAFTGLVGIGGSMTSLQADGSSVYGQRNLELRPTSISNAAVFDYWGIEAATPGLVMLPLIYRPVTYGLWAQSPYAQNQGKVASTAASGQANVVMTTTTVTNAMAATGDIGAVGSIAGFPQPYGQVKIDNEIIWVFGMNTNNNTMTGCSRAQVNSTAATHLASATVYPYVRIGDTVTLNPGGANQETLTIQSIATNTITFTTNLVNTHSAGEVFAAGFQDADMTKLNNLTISLANEFDANVFTVPVDDLSGTGPGGKPNWQFFSRDATHPNDLGHSLLAQRFYSALIPRMVNNVALAMNPTPMDWTPWQGDSQYSMITLLNSWTAYTAQSNYYTETTYSPRIHKDQYTGFVIIEGAVQNSSAANINAVIFTLPKGCCPGEDITRVVPSQNGPTTIQIRTTGDVQVMQGGSISYLELGCMFMAEL